MAAHTADLSILVIDDDALLRQALQDMLELIGYRVQTAATAYDGLRVLKTSDPPPDLIITDFRLPGTAGDQFFEWVQTHESWRLIPFIFISGSQEDLTTSWVRWESNVVACLTKPFPIQDLFDAIEQTTSAARAG